MKHIISCLACFMLVLFSCQHENSSSTKLPDLEELYADSIETPPILLSVTSLFTLGKDTLVVYQQKDDTLFTFWKLPECSFLFKNGVMGDGPNEFLALDKTFQGKANGFRAFEIQTSKIKEVSINGEGDFSVTSRRLEAGQMMNRFIFLNDDTYCFMFMDSDSEYALYNEKDGLKPFGNYPEVIEGGNKGEPKIFTYNKLTVANSSGDKFAAFYAKAKLCRIYNSEGKLLHERFWNLPKFNDDGTPKLYYSFQPSATDEHIYVLTKEKGECILEVWNWDAVMERRFLLDKSIDKYVFDAAANCLYATSVNKESYFYVYKLQE
ncbi:MAG: hypothetical protein IKY99_10610 [Bacteroidaceae bacterium]|nr:hypothetical protein [Bacteroidaceae bacterium]MBR5613517.1 hypothetical protein [Bacteroidaceae bacterium]